MRESRYLLFASITPEKDWKTVAPFRSCLSGLGIDLIVGHRLRCGNFAKGARLSGEDVSSGVPPLAKTPSFALIPEREFGKPHGV